MNCTVSFEHYRALLKELNELRNEVTRLAYVEKGMLRAKLPIEKESPPDPEGAAIFQPPTSFVIAKDNSPRTCKHCGSLLTLDPSSGMSLKPYDAVLGYRCLARPEHLCEP